VAGDSSPWSRRSSGANVAPLFAAAAAVAAQGGPSDEYTGGAVDLADYLDDDD